MIRTRNQVFRTLWFFIKYVRNPEKQTYYPESPRKSDFRICLENLWWLIRYREVNWSYYLYGLDRKGTYLKNYLAENIFNKISIHVNNRAKMGRRLTGYGAIIKDKFLFYEYAASLGYPIPPLLGLIYRDRIHWLESGVGDSLQSIARQTDMDGFVKEVLDQGGHGVYRVQVKNGKLLWNNTFIEPESIEHLIQGPCVLQRRIIQHVKLNKLCPYSVCTLRIVTMLTKTGVEVLAMAFRVGTRQTHNDNWSTGGLTIGINEEKGTLRRYGFYQPRFGRKVDRHPDTHCVFEGFKLPYYDQAIAMVTELHSFFYGLHTIGWDIAITDDGPLLMEANENWGLRLVHVHTPQLKHRYLSGLPRNIFEVC